MNSLYSLWFPPSFRSDFMTYWLVHVRYRVNGCRVDQSFLYRARLVVVSRTVVPVRKAKLLAHVCSRTVSHSSLPAPPSLFDGLDSSSPCLRTRPSPVPTSRSWLIVLIVSRNSESGSPIKWSIWYEKMMQRNDTTTQHNDDTWCSETCWCAECNHSVY